ncbi:MAG TPA: choice-of-anchor Q domain-containing protein [Nannocystaceae bacterium]|nr:choice-of-anchor Q domain-containing protein [Nannocystaceae bacterium]
MRTRFEVMLVMASVGLPASAWAGDIYVDAAAAGGGDGSAAMPFSDIQAGLDLAMPGDVVHVAPGMYPAITTVRAGMEDARISVVADSRRTAIVSGPGTGLQYAHDYHTFEGLVFDGGYLDEDLIVGDGGNHIEFIDVEVRRASNDCFDLRNSTDITIEGSFIHHCISVDPDTGEVDDSHGITGDSVFDLTVRNTEIAMASGDSVQLSPPREPWGNLLIEGCTLWTMPNDDPDAPAPMDAPLGENAFDSKVGADLDGNGANPRVVIRDVVAYGFVGFIGNQTAFNLKEDVDATVDRVTIYESELGFRLRGPAVVKIQNAVVYGVDNVVRYEEGITGVVISNMTIGGGNGPELFEDGGGGWVAPVVENLLVLDVAPPPDANPASSMMVGADVFIDAAGNDYRLVEGSTPIDAGVVLADVTEDRDGVARPYGDGFDIGAYEWNPDTGPADSSGGDDSATGVDDTAGDGADGTAGDGASLSAGDDVGDGTDGGGTMGSGDSGEGGSGSGDDDSGGCDCRSSPRPTGAALLLLSAAGARRRGRGRETMRDRKADSRASRSR